MSDQEETSVKRAVEEEEKNGAGENGNKKRKVSGDDSESEPVELIEKKDERSQEAGVMIVCGGVNWDVIGRKEAPKGAKPPPTGVSLLNLWGPHVWGEKVRVRSVASSSTACHSILITEDGKAYSWGRNDCGQLGHGDTETRYTPTLIEALQDETIVQAATGKGHTLFLNEKGIVYSCGSNKMGQLGQGNEGKDKFTPAKIDYKGKPIVRMACGADFTMIVDISGGLYSFGSPEYGQLGHNSDGKMLEKAGKITFKCENSPRLISKYVEKNKGQSTVVGPVTITDVKCGTNHAVAMDDQGRVFTWGFAGYGRLGHSETKDELVPRQVKQLENLRFKPTRIAAGSTFCITSSDANKMIYFWGQTKSSGEATMYPKPLQDLCGWNIRSIACCNKSIVIATEDTVVSWGPSPTYGELGYGENRAKSSTTPQEMKPIDGIHIKEVSCGFGHTLMIARDQSDEDRAKIAKLPRWP